MNLIDLLRASVFRKALVDSGFIINLPVIELQRSSNGCKVTFFFKHYSFKHFLSVILIYRVNVVL